MKIAFTKMQGAGNDFIVLDETRALLGLGTAQYRWLAHRHFGVGADQILSVRSAPSPELDFAYVIHNGDGQEVEHCGNGARCFVRYVHEKGLSNKNPLRVQTQKTVISLEALEDGMVRVDMGAPFFGWQDIPFVPEPSWHQEAEGIDTLSGATQLWPIAGAHWSVLSMGNPHAVARFEDIDNLDLEQLGRAVQAQSAFPKGVNVGVMQVLAPSEIKLRVFERGVGETLACGTGACAAVVAGVVQGWLEGEVTVHTRGGDLRIDWPVPEIENAHASINKNSDANPQARAPNKAAYAAGLKASVMMSGPAVTVFDAQIDIPDELSLYEPSL